MLVVEFESEQYTGSESSGFVEVVVIISGGSSTTPISVMMTIITRGRSAAGEGYINNQYINYSTPRCMKLGHDLDTESIALTFVPKEVNKTTNISVNCDTRSENEERFDIRLRLTSNNPQVRTGRDRSVGIIRDSTGNDGTVVSIGNDMIE